MPRTSRLSTLLPRIGGLAPRVGYAPGDEKGRDRQRRSLQPSKRWLGTGWWLTTRRRVLERDHYTCRSCGAIVSGKGEAHVDHITPHNESREMFFCSDDGLQTLCVHCHVSKKQAEERRLGLIR